MILLTSQLLYSRFNSFGSSQRVLKSIVYDVVGNRFVRINQRISADLAQDLLSSNPMIDITDVISLDYVDYVFSEEELEDIFEMVENPHYAVFRPDNDIINKAKEFIISYRRDKKIEKIILR